MGDLIRGAQAPAEFELLPLSMELLRYNCDIININKNKCLSIHIMQVKYKHN